MLLIETFSGGVKQVVLKKNEFLGVTSVLCVHFRFLQYIDSYRTKQLFLF